MNELKDYMYYSQLRAQGLNSMQRRTVSDRIPLAHLPDLMRAIGFFPTEQQVQDMINEVKFSEYAVTGKYVEEVDINTVVKLYINHRCVVPFSSRVLLSSMPHFNSSLPVPCTVSARQISKRRLAPCRLLGRRTWKHLRSTISCRREGRR